MERIASVVLLILVSGGVYFGVIDRKERQSQQNLEAVTQQSVLDSIAIADSVDAAISRFAIPHDSDQSTTSIVVSLDGRGSSDNIGDTLAYQWTLLDGDGVLNSDSTDVTTFSASSGEYTIKLTVTDNYGASSSKNKTVSVKPEPNDAPEVQIVASEE